MGWRHFGWLSFYKRYFLDQDLKKKRIKIMSKWRYLSLFQGILLNGSVQDVFCSLRFRSNRFKHSVKRFDRFGLTTLDFTKYFFIEREFLIFPHCTRNFCITWELFRKINFTVILFTKKFVFTENFSKTLDTKISLINCQMRWSSLLHVKMFVNFVTDILLCVTFLISRKCWKSSKYRTF